MKFEPFKPCTLGAKACKGGNTTQGIPCKKPVLSLYTANIYDQITMEL